MTRRVIIHREEKIYPHPVYNDYGCDINGDPYHIRDDDQRKLKIIYSRNSDYVYTYMSLQHEKQTIRMRYNIFAYECFTGKKCLGRVAHLDGDCTNNKKDNLVLQMPKNNSKALEKKVTVLKEKLAKLEKQLSEQRSVGREESKKEEKA